MNTKNKRVVITGIGVLSPNGIGKDAFWSSCVNGVSGISPIEGFDTSKSDYKNGGEIKNFLPGQFIPKDVAKRADRFAQLGLAAADMAISDSGLDIKNLNADRIGVSIGSGAGGLLFHEQEMMAIVKGIHQEAHPFSIPKVSPNAIASWIAIVYRIKGPNISITTACASGAHGIGQGLDMIRLGKADVVLAGGAEAPLTPFSFSAFSSMRVMSKSNEEPQKVMKPFDRKRDGFIMGEGSGILILEDLNHALKRKTKIYAELIGYGMSNGCYHMVIPSPDGEDYIRAMKMAIKDAGISPNKIDYINAHGTSTQANDLTETVAIKQVFGKDAYNIPISSTKSMTGHLLGASGAVEMAACVMTLNSGMIHPTINYETPDPNCDLDYVPNKARGKKMKIILSNSFGFGGNNASLIIKEYER